MALVYWFADGVGEKVTVGGPDGKTPIPTALIRWIRANGTPALIINGGDVYPSGNTKSFTEFFKQMDSDVRLMCEPPGNHDWKDVDVLDFGTSAKNGPESIAKSVVKIRL